MNTIASSSGGEMTPAEYNTHIDVLVRVRGAESDDAALGIWDLYAFGAEELEAYIALLSAGLVAADVHGTMAVTAAGRAYLQERAFTFAFEPDDGAEETTASGVVDSELEGR